MSDFIFIYLLGFLMCGLLYSILLRLKYFRNYYDDKFNEALSELSEESRRIIGDIDSEAVESWDIFITSLFSWLGFVYVILMGITVYINKFNKK